MAISTSDLADHCDELANNAEHKRTSLLVKLLSLASSLERAGIKLKKGETDCPINSLGEVQGMGSSIDVACAEYASAIRELNRALKLLEKARRIGV